MDEWDLVSHCITELNQSRALAEVDIIDAIDTILEAVSKCKQSLGEQSKDEKCADMLGGIVIKAEQSSLLSRKRDETVHSAISQLKQAISSALTHSGDDDDKEDELGLQIPPASPSESNLIDHALVWHFVHEGYLDTARTFDKESKLNCVPDADFTRIRAGLDAANAILIRKDLGPAISWLEEYSSATSSNLLFDLHRLRFLQLAASQTEAIGYAQRNFARFATSKSQEIQALLGGLLFHPASSSSSAASSSTLNDEQAWEQAREGLLSEIRRTYCSLSSLLSTGSQALAELHVYQNLVAADNRITSKSWTDQSELPVQVEAHGKYHSEFWCPVSQEQTDNQNNPPMLLVCGHVVAKNSILRIAKNRTRFKCPTCPTEQSIEAPTPIHF